MDFKQIVEGYREAMVADLQKLIAIRSVEGAKEGDMPFGAAVHEALESTLSLGASMGFGTKNVDNLAGHIEMGTGHELIGVLGHVDIVPEGKDWDYDPFGGQVVDGKLYGRGANDDKGPIISALYAMKALKDAGVDVNKRIRLILGTNEETGWAGITHYFKNEEHPTMGFSPDADFPAIHGEMGILVSDFKASFEDTVDDGGIEILSAKGGHAANMVPDYAEAVIKTNGKAIAHIAEGYNKDRGDIITLEEDGDRTLVKATGVSAHGSMPKLGVNAVSHLLCFLDALDLQIGDATNFVRHYVRLIGLEYNGQSIGVGFEDQYNKLVFNVGVLKMDQKEAKLGINIRYPITMKLQEVYDGMDKYLLHANWTHREVDHLGPIFLEPDHPLIENLMSVYTEITGDTSKPITIGGGTYARAAKNLVAFGPMFPGQEETAHQKNEYIAVDDLVRCAHIYANALYKLTR